MLLQDHGANPGISDIRRNMVQMMVLTTTPLWTACHHIILPITPITDQNPSFATVLTIAQGQYQRLQTIAQRRQTVVQDPFQCLETIAKDPFTIARNPFRRLTRTVQYPFQETNQFASIHLETAATTTVPPVA